MKKLNHLTQEERDVISILHAKLFGVRKIARELGRSPTTISRELNRKEAVYFRGDYIGSQTHKQVKVRNKTKNGESLASFVYTLTSQLEKSL